MLVLAGCGSGGPESSSRQLSRFLSCLRASGESAHVIHRDSTTPSEWIFDSPAPKRTVALVYISDTPRFPPSFSLGTPLGAGAEVATSILAAQAVAQYARQLVRERPGTKGWSGWGTVRQSRYILMQTSPSVTPPKIIKIYDDCLNNS